MTSAPTPLTPAWALVSSDPPRGVACVRGAARAVEAFGAFNERAHPTAWFDVARRAAEHLQQLALGDTDLAAALGWTPAFADVAWSTCAFSGACTFSVYLSR